MPPSGERSPRSTWLWWTAGKDAAWSLSVLRANPGYVVRGLVAPIATPGSRLVELGLVAERDLLEAQAAAVGLPLRTVEFDPVLGTTGYHAAVRRICRELRWQGARQIAFGDLSWYRLRSRRTVLLAGTGLEPVFPLWGRDSQAHAEVMLEAGLSAWVCSVRTTELAAGYLGRRYDLSFLADLPASVDPCGEHGEFHTFVEWAPDWAYEVTVEPGARAGNGDVAFVELRRSLAATKRSRLNRGERPASGSYDPFLYYARLRRVRSYVDEHLADELSIKLVADVAALAPSSFRRYFRKSVGITFGSWLARHRIERACELLRGSNAEVAQVGKQVGYGSDRSFRRAFRRGTGSSPSQYRKKFLAEKARPPDFVAPGTGSGDG